MRQKQHNLPIMLLGIGTGLLTRCLRPRRAIACQTPAKSATEHKAQTEGPPVVRSLTIQLGGYTTAQLPAWSNSKTNEFFAFRRT